MSMLLGVDTGGTYTDAVIFCAQSEAVIGSAKAPTTHDDLALGVAAAINAVLAGAEVRAEDIAMVSLSTTLATNALVEGKGQQAGLVLIGFDDATLKRPALVEALDGGPVLRLPGGHDPHGEELAPLDTSALADWAEANLTTTHGFAVTGEFGVRNSRHELTVRDELAALTRRPVTCAHRLSDALDGPRRAVTAVLNARLVGLTASLIDSVTETMRALNIEAPLMVVRGNGSLVGADYVRDRPVETLLSGPAASVVGAAYLTDRSNAVVADMGGTTTDIGVLVDGEVALAPTGASVGGHRTMVEAVDMVTCGLGGDSEIRLDSRGVELALTAGPRRVIPLCLLAEEHPEATLAALEADLASGVSRELHGVIVVPSPEVIDRALWPDDLGRHERTALTTLAVNCAPTTGDEVPDNPTSSAEPNPPAASKNPVAPVSSSTTADFASAASTAGREEAPDNPTSFTEPDTPTEPNKPAGPNNPVAPVSGSTAADFASAARTERANASAPTKTAPVLRPVSATAAQIHQREVLTKLVNRGLVRLAGVTPTDAAHVLGLQRTHSPEASILGVQLLARQRNGRGETLGDRTSRDGVDVATEVAQAVMDLVVRRSAEAILGAALTHDGLPASDVASAVVQSGLNQRSGITSTAVQLTVEVIGLGAPAPLCYPAVAALLSTKAILADNCEVANAVGAAVGRIRVRKAVTISSPEAGRYSTHLGDKIERHTNLDNAVAMAEAFLRHQLSVEMEAAGAGRFTVDRVWAPNVVDVDRTEVFVDGVLTMTATGRPHLS